MIASTNSAATRPGTILRTPASDLCAPRRIGRLIQQRDQRERHLADYQIHLKNLLIFGWAHEIKFDGFRMHGATSAARSRS